MNGAFKRRIQQARYNKVASPLVMVPWAFSGDLNISQPSIIPAVGMNVQWTSALPNPWISLRAAAKIAQHYVRASNNVNTAQLTNSQKAIVIGELTAIWSCVNPITLEVVVDARAHVENLIRHKPPLESQMRRSIMELIKALANSNRASTVSKQDMCEQLGLDEAVLALDEYPAQKLIWWKSRGNMIPWVDWCTNIEGQVLDTAGLSATDNNTYYVIRVPDEIILTANFPVSWSECDSLVRLSAIELLAQYDQDLDRTVFASCAVYLLASLAKSGNVSSDWLENRVERLKTLAPELRWDEWATHDILVEFVKRYPANKVDSDQIYAILQTVYSWFDEEQIGPLQWIIEQAATSNITLAIAFCEAITKCLLNPIPLIMTIIPYEEFKSIGNIIGWAMYDRYHSIHTPSKHMSSYADLAYLGKYISLQDKGKRQTGYMGDPTPWCQRSIRDLKALADLLLKQSTAQIESEGDFITTVLNKLSVAHVGHSDEVGWFRVNRPADLADGANEDQRQQYAAHMKLYADTASQNSIVVNGLRVPVTSLDIATVIRDYNESCTNRDRSAWQLCETLVSLAKQIRIPVISTDYINSTQRKVRLNDVEVNMLTAAQIPIEAIWQQDPPNIANLPVNNAVPIREYTVLSRGIRAPVHLAGARRLVAVAQAIVP